MLAGSGEAEGLQIALADLTEHEIAFYKMLEGGWLILYSNFTDKQSIIQFFSVGKRLQRCRSKWIRHGLFNISKCLLRGYKAKSSNSVL